MRTLAMAALLISTLTFSACSAGTAGAGLLPQGADRTTMSGGEPLPPGGKYNFKHR